MANDPLNIYIDTERRTFQQEGGLVLGVTTEVTFTGNYGANPALMIFMQDPDTREYLPIAVTERIGGKAYLKLNGRAAKEAFEGHERIGEKLPFVGFVIDGDGVSVHAENGASAVSAADPAQALATGVVFITYSPIIVDERQVFIAAQRGLSAYELAVKYGYTGTEEEWAKLYEVAEEERNKAFAESEALRNDEYNAKKNEIDRAVRNITDVDSWATVNRSVEKVAEFGSEVDRLERLLSREVLTDQAFSIPAPRSDIDKTGVSIVIDTDDHRVVAGGKISKIRFVDVPSAPIVIFSAEIVGGKAIVKDKYSVLPTSAEQTVSLKVEAGWMVGEYIPAGVEGWVNKDLKAYVISGEVEPDSQLEYSASSVWRSFFRFDAVISSREFYQAEEAGKGLPPETAEKIDRIVESLTDSSSTSTLVFTQTNAVNTQNKMFYVANESPSEVTGRITSVMVKSVTSATRMKIGSCYFKDGNYYVRDLAEIDVSTLGERSVDIEIKKGDVIGFAYNEDIKVRGYVAGSGSYLGSSYDTVAAGATIGKTTQTWYRVPYADVTITVIDIQERTADRVVDLERNIASALGCLFLNPYPNLNIVLFGDSITWLGGVECDGVESETRNGHFGWPQFFKQMVTPKSIKNYAQSGQRWTHDSTTVYNPSGGCVYNQINKMIKEYNDGLIGVPDLAIICAGTNDVALQYAAAVSKEAGDAFVSDDPVFDPTNYETADVTHLTNLPDVMRYDIELLRHFFPKIRIILASPLQSASSSRPIEKTLRVSRLIEEVGNYLGCPTVRQDRECGVNRQQEMLDHVYLYDGIHTNEDGAKSIGYFFARKVASLMNNPS